MTWPKRYTNARLSSVPSDAAKTTWLARIGPRNAFKSIIMEFYNQWSNRPPHAPQEFKEPTCTVPNQSMTVQEIIAKYSRTGLVHQSFDKKDYGGNIATDPDFDPLDNGQDLLEAVAQEKAAQEAAAAAAAQPSAPAGEGGAPPSPA